MAYVKLIGAELFGETANAVQFVFGDTIRQVGKQQSKIEGTDLFIERWVAERNVRDWNAEFVPGTKWTEMRSRNIPKEVDNTVAAIAEIIALLEQVIAKLRVLR